jgi:hypothetical protein
LPRKRGLHCATRAAHHTPKELPSSERTKARADTLLDVAGFDRSAKAGTYGAHDERVGEEGTGGTEHTCFGEAAAKKAQEKW